MRNFFQFIQYHNAVPIGVSILLLGAGGAYAASDPGAVFSQTEKVVSVDNTYLVSKDLSVYSPRVAITGVIEDAEYYFVSYTVQTIDIDDSVWKDVQRNETMQVSKADLGTYRDLGTYVTDKLHNVVDREIIRLKETQAAERTRVSQKIVATEYGGLVGKFLDSTTEELPGYVPIVQPEPHQEFVEVEAPPLGSRDADPSQAGAAAGESVPAVSGSTNEPKLSVLGNNPAEVPLGSTYSDLGAVITSTPNNYTVHVYFDGQEVQQVSLDTSKTGEYVISYRAWNEKGETGEVTRRVRVFDPNAQQNTLPPSEPSPEPAAEIPAEPAAEPPVSADPESAAP